MKKLFLPRIRISVVVAVGVMLLSSSQLLQAQQYIIANKDNTRPDMDRITGPAITVSNFSATGFNGYNEVSWNVFSDQNIRSFTLEYSANSVDYQTAGATLPSGTSYRIKHSTADRGPMLYRVRTEQINGKVNYSAPFFMDGEGRSPVRINSNIISGNMINMNAAWPVERIQVLALDGTQVFAKEVNGQRDYISLAVPSLSKGMYLVAFYGNGWKSTEKIVVP